MEEKRALYIITEGKKDAAILHTLLDCKNYEKVYQVAAGGYGNLSSVAKTVRLMNVPIESNDKIIIVFDADGAEPTDRVNTMRYLTNADYDRRIGVFCFVPNIEESLFPKDYQMIKGINEELVDYMKGHVGELRDNGVIKEIQAFIDH